MIFIIYQGRYSSSNFFDKHFDIDNLFSTEEEGFQFKIKQTIWDKIYKSNMDKIRVYVKSHNIELLESITKLITIYGINNRLGNISKWENGFVSYYSHEHELSKVNDYEYGFADFTELPRKSNC